MIWLTWRQHRAQMAATAALVGTVCALLLWKGRTVHAAFDDGVGACLSRGGQCQDLINAFGNRFSNLQFLIPLVLVLPALIGLFWGAPLVAREVEQGTHLLAWVQGVTVRRWLVTKLAFVVAAAAAMAAAYAAVSSWFAGPFNRTAASRLAPGVFDLQGIVPVAYTLFALALGVAVGAVVRRVLPAMAATLGGYVAVRAAVALLARPRLLASRAQSYYFAAGNPRAGLGDWVVKAQIFDAHGHLFSRSGSLSFTPATLARSCPGTNLGGGAAFPGTEVRACIENLGLRTVETYHPASQFWALQGIEAVVFLTAAAGCVAFALWWGGRRHS